MNIYIALVQPNNIIVNMTSRGSAARVDRH